MTLTERQIWLVQSSFEKFIVDIDVASRQFYDRLFAMQPSLVPMFRGDTRLQGRKLVNMILFAVNALHDPDDLPAQIGLLSESHVSYGVRPEYYPLMGDVLIWTLRAALGRDFTPEVEQAWRAVWDHLSAVAIHAAGSSPTTHGG